MDKENIKISKSILSSYLNQDFSDDDLIIEKYNQEYASLSCNSLSFRSRLAKKTPTKKGYFLTIWTKDEDNNNRPFNKEESSEFLLVIIKDGDKEGIFKFPREVLVSKGIISDAKRGKMAFRVYPAWEVGLNTTALKTQKWQVKYFEHLTTNY